MNSKLIPGFPPSPEVLDIFFSNTMFVGDMGFTVFGDSLHIVRYRTDLV